MKPVEYCFSASSFSDKLVHLFIFMILFPERCNTGCQRSLVKMIIWSPFWEIGRPWGHETWLRGFMLIRNCRGLLCWHLQTQLMYLSVPQLLPSGPPMLSPLNVSWTQTHLVTLLILTFYWWKELRQNLENFLHSIRSISSTTTIKPWGTGACMVKNNKTRILIGSAEWLELCLWGTGSVYRN